MQISCMFVCVCVCVCVRVQTTGVRDEMRVAERQQVPEGPRRRFRRFRNTRRRTEVPRIARTANVRKLFIQLLLFFCYKVCFGHLII